MANKNNNENLVINDTNTSEEIIQEKLNRLKLNNNNTTTDSSEDNFQDRLDNLNLASKELGIPLFKVNAVYQHSLNNENSETVNTENTESLNTENSETVNCENSANIETSTLEVENNTEINQFKSDWQLWVEDIEKLKNDKDTILWTTKLFEGPNFNRNEETTSETLISSSIDLKELKGTDYPNALKILQESKLSLSSPEYSDHFHQMFNPESKQIIEKYKNLTADNNGQPEKIIKIIELNESTLKINVDLKHSKELFVKASEAFKQVDINTIVTVSGAIVPTIGTFYLYKRISNLYQNQLNGNLKHVTPAEKVGQITRNNKALALFNIFAMFAVGGVLSSYNYAIKKNTEFPFKIKTESVEEVKNSFLPLFILNKLDKLPKFLKKFFSILLLSLLYFVFRNYSQLVFDYFGLSIIHLIYLFKFLDLLIIYFILEAVIIIYFLCYEDNILENKLFILLNKSLKEEILQTRKLDFKSIVTYYNKTIILSFISLILILITEVIYLTLYL